VASNRLQFRIEIEKLASERRENPRTPATQRQIHILPEGAELASECSPKPG